MKISSKDFRVREGDEVNLKKWPTKVDPVYKSKDQYKKLLEEHVSQLSSQQQLLYASNRYAVLLIFQAMDAAGKDGAIQHVMSGVNPQGCQVFSLQTSQRRRIGTRLSLAHHARSAGTRQDRHFQPILLRGGADRPRPSARFCEARRLPDALITIRRSGMIGIAQSWIWRDTSTHNGTRIIKFFLHLSKEEQRQALSGAHR